jgi:hypothetical protein
MQRGDARPALQQRPCHLPQYCKIRIALKIAVS